MNWRTRSRDERGAVVVEAALRIDIPADYTCTPGVNPEANGNSCWWGIRYEFGASANDVTTWQARIEGNPLQLTQ